MAGSGEIFCICESSFSCARNDGDPAPHRALQWRVTDPNGVVIDQPVGQRMGFGSQIQYSCSDGYSLSGDKTRFCAEDGWSGRRTTCEEVSSGGLSNYHIAVIAASSSGFIILVISILLIVCCCRDHNKKKKKRKQLQHRRMRAARDNEGFVLNLALAGNDDFLYSHTIDRRAANNGFSGRHNDIRKYQGRPHMLPAAPTPNQHTQDIRPKPRSPFRPQDVAGRSYLDGGVNKSPRTSKVNIKAPPPGYMEPPPSYDTMVREGYSNHVVSNNRRNRR